jgi:hypothetical protein
MHKTWKSSSLTPAFDILKSDTHAHITDAYLLGLAVHKKGKLATLDRRIPAESVTGGSEALELVPVTAQ